MNKLMNIVDYAIGKQQALDRELEREERRADIIKNDKQLINRQCTFEFDRMEKEINGYDRVDENNQPACYNQTKRGISKAWDVLVDMFDSETTMYQGLHILTDCGLRMRSYCRMD